MDVPNIYEQNFFSVHFWATPGRLNVLIDIEAYIKN